MGEIRLSNDQDEEPSSNGIRLNGLNFKLSSETGQNKDERETTANGKPSELVSARMEAGLDSLQQGQRATGAISLALQMNRLGLQSLENVRQSLNAIYSNNMPTQLQQLALQGLLMRELPALSATAPEVKVETLEINLGDKQINGSLDLRLAPTPQGKKNALGLIEIVDLAASISLPRKVVESVAAMQAAKRQPTTSPADLLKEWLDKGWLIAMGDNYHSNLRLADSRLTVNGNESETWANWLELQRIHQLHKKGLEGHGNWRKRLKPRDESESTLTAPTPGANETE
ncbi:MAG: DUF945 family protein [Salinisphaeraceae bacterium]|nr:DUF945 family protein [Salinisphaeraceae bacterium]